MAVIGELLVLSALVTEPHLPGSDTPWATFRDAGTGGQNVAQTPLHLDAVGVLWAYH